MKQFIKTIISLLLISVIGILQLAATPITQQQAQQNVQTFLESKGMATKASTLRLSQPKFTSTSMAYYYVFNIGDNDGYVIAAGDDCAPAILGYADSGSVDVDSMPENMKAWLEEYASQIEYMQKHQLVASPKLTTSSNAISPLMTTTWGQEDPYNQNCPDFFSNGKSVTGCVATAMAQVMYYHRANSVTQTTAQIPAYDCRTLWLNGSDTLGHIHVDAIPAGSPIDWDNMLDSYSGSSTTAQQQAVANLMKYCGASVQMDYGAWYKGSYAYSSDVPIALKTYFNYSDETVFKYRSDYSSQDAWESLIYNELNSSRPVYYSGRNSSGGHAFVCDGYDGSGYYHINWGWSGTSDGYFLLTALDPDQQGTGGSSSGYNLNQAAIINAQPKSSTPSNPVLATSISLNKTSATVTEGNTLQLTVTVLPTNTTNKTVTWKSSNTSVATVSSSGLVTAKSSGSATITATTTDGTNLSATCYITVESSSPQSSIISFVDANVKALCVQNWDTNGDGELSKAEAATVTSLGSVFKSNKNITSFDELQYFTGLTYISYEAFYGCSGLTSVTIPNSVTSIGNSAFEFCRGLTSITIPSSVTSIGILAFDYCTGLTSITIPSSVTSIGGSAFNSSGLTSITIPSSVTSIGSSAFGYCSGLASITVDSNNTTYDSRSNCNAIIETASNTLIAGSKNTIIPTSVTSIGGYAFSGRGMTSITIPASVTSIGSSAFHSCRSLTSITIPSSVTSIGSSAFGNCIAVVSITVDSNNTVYDSRDNCNAIIKKSNNELITGCKNTIIPSSVTSIGSHAFGGCWKLTSVTIPSSVTNIGDYAFYGCSELNDVFSLIDNPMNISIGSSVFVRIPNNYAERTLHVPAGTVSAYQSDTKWSDYFGSIVEMDPVLAESIKLNVTTAGLNEGATLQLTATVLPEECDNKTVLWASDNPSVATVDSNGLVTTHSVGTATITANTTDGSNLSTTCTVTLLPVGVKGDVNGDNGITISDVTSLIDYLLTGHWPEP